MIKPLSIVVAGLLIGACYSASASNIDKETKEHCRALPGVENVSELEVIRACEAWIQAAPGNGDALYYYGRTIVDGGDTERALELFDEGRRKGSQLAEDAYWFARQGSLIGGLTTLSGQSLEHFQTQAEAGNQVAEVLIGIQIAYQEPGNPTEEDQATMLRLFKSASDKGEPIATYLLGSFQVNDENPDNDGSGVRLLRIAAEEGVGVAYNDLERIGEIGEVPIDYFNTRYRSAAPVDLVMRRP